jgi:hypothetical protein
MKRFPFIQRSVCTLILSALLGALLVPLCGAAEPVSQLPASSGKKKLLLLAKNPSTWARIKTGGTGTMIYREAIGAFSLKASGLLPRSRYALVRYADKPPHAEILARGESDGQGGLELNGVWQNWTRKFWLVSGEDVQGKVGEAGSFVAWRPKRYLFEEKQLGIACVCPEPEEHE